MPKHSTKHVTTSAPHRTRARQLLRAHPEARQLLGPTRWTAALTVGLVLLHVAIAAAAVSLPWWGAVLLAFGVGAFVSNALYAVLHECSHDLTAKSRVGNRLVALIANLPLLLPVAESYGHYHRMHHRHQGVVGRDPDLPDELELRLARTRLGKLLWHATFPLWQALRLRALRQPPRSVWLGLNGVIQLAVVVCLALFWPKVVLYLGLSFYFTMALHPLAARLIQEHHLTDGDQETTSYYGPLSALTMHVGHHNEHHDLPGVPWTRLPRLRRLAPEIYGSLHSHRSWTGLWLRFLLTKDLGPHSRMTR